MAATTSVCNSKTGVSSRKFKCSYNVINRLQIREVHGSLQPYKYHFPQYRSVIGKIPGRLCIPLKDIVNMTDLLDQGHVFLGFTKDGQFTLSYTLRVEAHEHTALPIYVYRLHWWHFNYLEPMIKVAEIRLFGEEEIQDDLYIAVCSWPTDPTKVFVYGSCPNGGTSDEKRQCYITITSVPPISPCKDCADLYTSMKSRNNNNFYRDEENMWNFPEMPETDSTQRPPPPRCLKHGLVVHTKYELSPPFPLFAPKFSLKRDGLAVINTGYSLIALGVKVNSATDQSSQSSLYSTAINSSYPCTQETSDTAGSSYHQVRTDSQASSGIRSPAARGNVSVTPDKSDKRRDPTYPSMHSSSPGASGSPLSVARQREDSLPLMLSQESSDDAHCQNFEMTNCDLSSQDVNADSSTLQHTRDNEMSKVGEMTHTVTSKGRRQVLNIQNESCHSDTCTSGKTGKTNSGECEPLFSCLMPEFKYSMKTQQDSCCTDDETDMSDSDVTNISECSDDEQEATSPVNWTIDSKSGDTSDESRSGNVSVKKTGSDRQQMSLGRFDWGSPDLARDSPSYPCRHSPSCRAGTLASSARVDLMQVPLYGACLEDSDKIGCEIDQSCPIHGASKINLSWNINSVTDLDICNCQQRGFNYSVRRYIERPPDTDSPLDIEDEFHSMLPLEVHGAGYSLLTRTRRSPETQGTYVEVKQLTMDAEQYISEAVKSHAKWQDRYLDFTDYDMQILDVCPDSCNVLVMILTLVRAKPEYDPWSLDFECEDETPRLFQTGFKFTWNLKTGLYETLEVEDLKEFDQAQLCNQWNPGRYLCQKIQRDWSTPQGFVRSVHVLTNEAVWKRQSLKKLVDPVHFVAITL